MIFVTGTEVEEEEEEEEDVEVVEDEEYNCTRGCNEFKNEEEVRDAEQNEDA